MSVLRVFCILLGALWFAAVKAGPSCDVSHEFVGFTTESDTAFFIGSITTGECQGSLMWRLAVIGDSLTSLTSLQFGSRSGQSMSQLLKTFRHEDPKQFGDSLEDWIDLDSNFAIHQPTPSQEILARFKASESYGYAAYYWNRLEGSPGVDLPWVKGDSLSLVAIDTSGFYLNYQFVKVLYFPKTGYVLIITRNDRYADEFDTENGFLLLRRRSFSKS